MTSDVGATSAASDQRAPDVSLFVLGAGRAGRAVAAAARAAGLMVTGEHRRSAPTVADLATGVTGGAWPPALREAALVFVAVRDGELDALLEQLARDVLAPGATVLHASGAREPDALTLLRVRGHPCGTFHPLVPLTGAATGAARLRGAWIGVEGDAVALGQARRLAAAIGAHVLQIPAGQRALYHAAAVFASNFPVVLAATAAGLLREAGVRAEEADGAVRALLASAAENVAAAPLDPAGVGAVLTGPVVRGDAETIAAHLRALPAADPRHDAYAALSRLAVDVLRAAGSAPPRLADVLLLLDAADAPAASEPGS